MPEMPGLPLRVHERLRAQDRFFLDQESPGSAMNVGALVRVEGLRHGSLRDDIEALFASRIHLMPRLRQRLVEVAVPGEPLVWIDDEHFDLSRRILELDFDSPPTDEEVLEAAGQRIGSPLDRRGPLWDIVVIPRTAGGESALIVRWHHALIDGMSGVEIGKLLLDTRRDARPEPAQTWTPEPAPDASMLIAEALAVEASESLRLAIRRSLPWVDDEEPSLSPKAMLDGLTTFTRLGAMPPNPFTPRSPGERRYASATVPEASLQRIRKRFDVSAEVVALALVTGAASRLLHARGQSFENLRVFIPRTVRFRGRAQSLGNHATFNVVDLPAGAMSESERIRRIAECVDSVRASNQAEAVSAVADVIATSARMPWTLNQQVARWFGNLNTVHVVVSYMRGPRQSLYLAGRSHLGTCPILPRSNGVGLLVGLVSLGGVSTFGLVADPAAVPDLEFLSTAIGRACTELCEGERPPPGEGSNGQ